MAGFPTLKGSWPWPWFGSYCIPSCITHRPLPTYQISFKSKKHFCGRRYARTDGHLRPSLLGRLCRRVDLKTWILSSGTLSQTLNLVDFCLFASAHWSSQVWWTVDSLSHFTVQRSPSFITCCSWRRASCSWFATVATCSHRLADFRLFCLRTLTVASYIGLVWLVKVYHTSAANFVYNTLVMTQSIVGCRA